MPKYADVKIRPCPDKPKKEVLYRAILESLGNKDLGFNEDEVQKVDSAWLIVVLGTINPGHRFFNKDYVPTKDERRNQDYLDPKMVDNTDGFFTGLPLNNMKRMKAKPTDQVRGCDRLREEPDNDAPATQDYARRHRTRGESWSHGRGQEGAR